MKFLFLTLIVSGLSSLSLWAKSDTHHIAEKLVAPCCWRENLAAHQSPEAEQLRAEIDQLVAAGKTEPEIIELYIERFGQRILREPRGTFFWWLAVTPVVIFLLGFLWIIRYVKKHTRQVAPASVDLNLLPAWPKEFD